MKHLRIFDSVSDMETYAASAEIDFVGLAYDNGEPVLKVNNGGTPTPPTPSTSTPFYVENISLEDETLSISEYDAAYGAMEIPIEYSTDGSTWSSLGTTGEFALTRTLHPNDKVYLRATTDSWYGDSNYCMISGVSKVGGNIMSLLYGSNFTGNETTFPNESYSNFSYLFYHNTHLVDASELLLPATTLADYCYQSMFLGCTSLTSAPALPATTLAYGCYYFMFRNCTSLTSAPVLPATTLTRACYYYMFSGCTALTSAPVLPATTLAESCYQYMFSGCTALTSAPVLPATSLATSCYSYMFSGCTHLTSAPVLPATTLANNCYQYMFYGCTGLTTAPVLPATTLVNECYRYMFQNCTSLNYIKCLATDISAESCTSFWVHDVASSGTFVKDPDMESWTIGNNGIPSGWTVEDATE